MVAWHEVGATSLCAEGELREFKVADQVVLLWCMDGQFHAAQGLCPHLKAHLAKGKLEGTVITCPGHGSRFDLLTGEVIAWIDGLHGPARSIAEKLSKPKGLTVYPVKVVDNRVMIQF